MILCSFIFPVSLLFPLGERPVAICTFQMTNVNSSGHGGRTPDLDGDEDDGEQGIPGIPGIPRYV